jgi:hypothetical protein
MALAQLSISARILASSFAFVFAVVIFFSFSSANVFECVGGFESFH